MKILSTEILAKTPFVELKQSHYVNTQGKTSKWDYASRTSNTKAVMIVPYVGDKILLIKEFRVPIADYEWSFPAGLIDGDETIETAARRELLEETNLKLDKILQVSPFAYNSAGITDEAIAIMYVEASGNISTQANEASEDITPYLMNKADVEKLLADSTQKFSAKCWIILNNFVNPIAR